MESDTNAFRVEFPDFSCSILQKLNQQRQRGQLCDIIVSIGGHQYRAHRAVLAASSPYFCDQVLLKNSARVVLPEVMNPWVFEGLLQSCYTGALNLPACEVVAFLTAASFLQMWHVVDKCTELLEGSSSRSHKTSSGGRGNSSQNEQHASPDGDSQQGDRSEEGFGEGTGVGGSEGFGRMTSCRGSSDFEQLLEESFSPQTLDLGAPPSGNDSMPPDREGSASEDGDTETQLPKSRPVYVPPSIMGHRKWTQVKTERLCREDCSSMFNAETASIDSDQLGLSHHHQGTSSSMHSVEDSVDEKLVSELEEGLDCDPLDFYGTSMERLSNDKDGPSPSLELGTRRRGGGGVGGGDDDADDDDEDGMDAVAQDETSSSGFGSGVYKLYPCQCGKSFTHKSQRDRHMSMHLGLRPYGCAVCGKSFKMKHHLVGHMKIHTGIKPYECSLCSKRFMWRDSFNRHTASCRRANQGKRSATEQSVC